MRRKLAGTTRTVGLWCAAASAFLASAANAATVRFQIADENGVLISDAKVELLSAKGKPQDLKQIDKQTWSFETDDTKVQLNVHRGRTGGLAELEFAADASAEFSYLLRLQPSGVKPELVSTSRPGGKNTSNLRQNLGTTKAEVLFAPPANDLCGSAITVAVPSVTPGTTVEATVDAGLPSCTTSVTAGGVWYSFTGTGTSVTASLCTGTPYDSKITVFSGSCATPVCVAGNDDTTGCGGGNDGSVTFCATLGVNYLVLVHGFSSGTGAFELTLASGASCAPPANDLCVNATPVGALPASVSVTNTFATNDTLAVCGSSPHNKTTWFTVVGDGTTFTASTCDALTTVGDTELIVYCGDCVTPLCIGGDDDACPGPPNPPGSNGNQSIFSWCTQAGATYLIAVGNFSSTLTGNIQLNVTSSGSSCPGPISCLTITGACCVAGTCTGTLEEADCLTAGGTWFVGESCPAFACPQPCTRGDTCAAPTDISGVPYNDASNTCSCSDNYDETCPFVGPGSADIVYRYTPAVDECVDITLCNGTNYDSKVYVYSGSCPLSPGSPFACNDDLCALQSEISGLQLIGGTTYYIVIDGYDGDCGDYVLDISACAGPCNVTCSPGSTAEGEPDCGPEYNDQFNGGCNSIPSVFSDIACGQSVCGESGNFLVTGQEACIVDADCPFIGDTCVGGLCVHQTRDTDWYTVTLATAQQLTFTVESEFPGLFGIVDTGGIDDCAFVTSFLIADVTDPCTPNSVTAPVPAGTWYLFVSTADFAGVTCGSEYSATLDCAALPDGACCAANGSCSITNQPDCAGVWQGPGSGCTPNPCPQPPANDHCDQAVAVAVPSTTPGTTAAADVDSGFPSPCGDSTITSPGVWYSVIGTGNSMTASLCNGNTAYDSKMSVFCPDCVAPVCVDGNDDFCGLQSEVSWCSALGQTYLILVHGFGGDNGPFELVVSDDGAACPAPVSCVAVPPCPGPGDCCVDNFPTIGCSEQTCCETVCACDSFCCGDFGGGWDSNCAGPNLFVPGCSALDLCVACQPQPETGGCCQGLACSILTQADCATAGGTYLGDGSDCSGPGAGNPRLYEADPGLAIPDGDPVGITDVINVPDSFTIGSVDVDLRIPHTWVGDLIVTITHNATSVTVVDQMGFPTLAFGCNSNDLDVVIDDDGTGGPIEALCGPSDADPTPTSPPSYLPASALSAFNGMDAAGPWTITVSDNAGFDTGTLEHWSLHIDEPGPSPCVPRGACCTSETVCLIQTQADCTGVYLGDGTNCGAGGPVTTFVSDPNVAIPDNDPLGVSDSINVPASFTVTDVDVDLVVPHTWVGDLIVTLTHGGTVTIVDRIEFPLLAFGCNSNDLDIVLDDEGTGGAIEDNCGPSDADPTPTSPPNYIPSGALSAFDGSDSSGLWTISITDNAGFDTGSLVHWSLHLQQAGPGPCEGAFTGACCDTNGPNAGCVDGVTAQDCVGPDKVFTAGATCNSPNYTCACIPNCAGRECGDDGCGGSCGSCDDGNGCTNDSCDVAGQCVNTPVVCNDNVACTSDACVSGACQYTPNDAACDDGFFCTGVETCSAAGCVSGTSPCTGTETCNEDSDTCETGAIPTVSAWGLAVLALILMVGAKLGFGRKEATA